MVFENIIGIIALLCAIWVIYDVLAKNKAVNIPEIFLSDHPGISTKINFILNKKI